VISAIPSRHCPVASEATDMMTARQINYFPFVRKTHYACLPLVIANFVLLSLSIITFFYYILILLIALYPDDSIERSHCYKRQQAKPSAN